MKTVIIGKYVHGVLVLKPGYSVTHRGPSKELLQSFKGEVAVEIRNEDVKLIELGEKK